MSAIINPASTPVQREERPAPKPVEAKPPSRGKWVILFAVVALGAGLAYRLLHKPAQPVAPVASFRTAKITRGALERTTRVAGQTSARHYANIIAPILRGYEARGNLFLLKLAKGGSNVKKGDMLAEIDAQSAQDHMDDTMADVVQAQLDVKKRLAEQAVELENLQQTLRVTKADLDKSKLEAGASEIRTVIDQELLKLSVEENTARYKQQGEDLKSKQVAHKSELRILEITAIRQQRHLDRHLADIKRYSIKAPMDGLVVMMSVIRGPGDMAQIQQGDQVFPGSPIMKVVNASSMQVEASVNQAESANFRVGQECRISLDAFPGLQLKGKIYSMGALAAGGWRQNYYIRNVPIRIGIDGSDPRLIPDLSAAVDVVLERVDDAVIVPLGAVSMEKDKPVVYVKTGETFAKRDVKLGLQSYTHAAVLEGLEAGEEVRLN